MLLAVPIVACMHSAHKGVEDTIYGKTIQMLRSRDQISSHVNCELGPRVDGRYYRMSSAQFYMPVSKQRFHVTIVANSVCILPLADSLPYRTMSDSVLQSMKHHRI